MGKAADSSDGNQEGMGGLGQRVLSQLLNEMDGVSARSGVLLLACSSRPDLLDPALLRPGRLERLVYVGPPSTEARIQLFEVYTLTKTIHQLRAHLLIKCPLTKGGKEENTLCNRR